jgi:hypothetical protein
MTRLAAATAVVALITAMAGTALAGAVGNVKVTLFKATYAGQAVVKKTDNLLDISATGVGTGTVIGKGKITGIGKGDASVTPCVPWTGKGTMSSAKAKLLFKVNPGATGCGSEEDPLVSIVGRATITKGTGKFLKARGTLKLTGTYNQDTGKFSIKFNGRILQ